MAEINIFADEKNLHSMITGSFHTMEYAEMKFSAILVARK